MLTVPELTVRRTGWTLAGPGDGRIEPDTARLLLRARDPAVDIVASIGMDGFLDAPILRHEDEGNGMRKFDHAAHELNERGIGYVTSLFKAEG